MLAAILAKLMDRAVSCSDSSTVPKEKLLLSLVMFPFITSSRTMDAAHSTDCRLFVTFVNCISPKW